MKKKVKDFTPFEIEIECDMHLCDDCPFKSKDEDIYYCQVNKEIKRHENIIKESKNAINRLKTILEKEIEVEEDDR